MRILSRGELNTLSREDCWPGFSHIDLPHSIAQHAARESSILGSAFDSPPTSVPFLYDKLFSVFFWEFSSDRLLALVFITQAGLLVTQVRGHHATPMPHGLARLLAWVCDELGSRNPGSIFV